jgi:hypothetical protein
LPFIFILTNATAIQLKPTSIVPSNPINKVTVEALDRNSSEWAFSKLFSTKTVLTKLRAADRLKKGLAPQKRDSHHAVAARETFPFLNQLFSMQLRT